MSFISKILTLSLTATLCCVGARAQEKLAPNGTYLFAQRDTCDLYMDDYLPVKEKSQLENGQTKPTILFVFGGGFLMGQRSSKDILPWFEKLHNDGYRVLAIDYRLGLKGVKKMGIAQADLLWDAIHMAVDDLFCATNFIIENAEELDIDPYNIVVCGSSAGAITAMQAEWEICNRIESALSLPEDFNYAGVMSFSGAIFSRIGAIRYEREPAPTMMLHGTADKLVPYDQIWFFSQRFAGTNVIGKTFINGDYNYNILRFKDYQHEIAASFMQNYDAEIDFLEDNVAGGKKKCLDVTIDEIDIKRFNVNSPDDLYK